MSKPKREYFKYRDLVIKKNTLLEIQRETKKLNSEELAIQWCNNHVKKYEKEYQKLINRVRHLENKLRKKKKVISRFRETMKVLRQFDENVFRNFKAMYNSLK